MSMTTLVILQFVGIFAAYTGLTVLLPAVSDVLYIWKFLYYKYCICGSAASYFQFSDTCAAYCGSECADLEQGEPDFSEKTYHKECRSLQKTSPGQHGNKRSLLQSMAKVHQNAEICNLFLLSRSGM